jgi:hypothetical protein
MLTLKPRGTPLSYIAHNGAVKAYTRAERLRPDLQRLTLELQRIIPELQRFTIELQKNVMEQQRIIL